MPPKKSARFDPAAQQSAMFKMAMRKQSNEQDQIISEASKMYSEGIILTGYCFHHPDPEHNRVMMEHKQKLSDLLDKQYMQLLTIYNQNKRLLMQAESDRTQSEKDKLDLFCMKSSLHLAETCNNALKMLMEKEIAENAMLKKALHEETAKTADLKEKLNHEQSILDMVMSSS